MPAEVTDMASVGIYSAASVVSEVWYVLPTAVATAAFPALLTARETNLVSYRNRVQLMLDIFAWGGLSIATVITIFSKPIIVLLYGASYLSAAPVLAIHVWAAVFIFMRAVLSKWIIAEGLEKESTTSHSLGAAATSNLNLYPFPGSVCRARQSPHSFRTPSRPISPFFFCPPPALSPDR